eukprot:3527642-Karenia_brevis.AAC.1
MPNRCSQTDLRKIYEGFEIILDSLRVDAPNHSIVVCGDFNTHVLPSPPIFGAFAQRHESMARTHQMISRSEALNAFASAVSLTFWSTYFDLGATRVPWRREDGRVERDS